jgi:glycosyltransferase involved in cell wall biosynthesis
MQSYRNIEHIVIDGGSTDESINILEYFRINDNRFRYVSEPDNGQGDAVNKGFKLCRGEIIAWLNSDDFYFEEDVFQFIIDFFKNNPEIDIIYGGMAYVDELNKINNIRIPPNFNRELLKMISYIGNTNAFFRRAVIEKHQLESEYHFVIDHEFMLRITSEFTAHRTKKILGCFRVHNLQKTQTLSNAIKDKERTLRDARHGIKRNLNFKIKQLLARLKYRFELYYTDFKLLKKFKYKVPFEKFNK